MEIVLKVKTVLSNNFHFKDCTSKDLCVVYKFQCWLYNDFYYGKCVRHLHVKIGNILVYHHLA